MARFQIRARFDAASIVVYQAYAPSIARPALRRQALVPPFRVDRMTWIKPSLTWLLRRSDWARSAGQERILALRIRRAVWERWLGEAVLTTPEPRVYPCPRRWRRQLERARVRVQWDPERDVRGARRSAAAIQVGLLPPRSAELAGRAILAIDDMTPTAHRIRRLLDQGRVAQARRLLPRERIYPASPELSALLGLS